MLGASERRRAAEHDRDGPREAPALLSRLLELLAKLASFGGNSWEPRCNPRAPFVSTRGAGDMVADPPAVSRRAPRGEPVALARARGAAASGGSRGSGLRVGQRPRCALVAVSVGRKSRGGLDGCDPRHHLGQHHHGKRGPAMPGNVRARSASHTGPGKHGVRQYDSDPGRPSSARDLRRWSALAPPSTWRGSSMRNSPLRVSRRYLPKRLLVSSAQARFECLPLPCARIGPEVRSQLVEVAGAGEREPLLWPPWQGPNWGGRASWSSVDGAVVPCAATRKVGHIPSRFRKGLSGGTWARFVARATLRGRAWPSIQGASRWLCPRTHTPASQGASPLVQRRSRRRKASRGPWG